MNDPKRGFLREAAVGVITKLGKGVGAHALTAGQALPHQRVVPQHVARMLDRAADAGVFHKTGESHVE